MSLLVAAAEKFFVVWGPVVSPYSGRPNSVGKVSPMIRIGLCVLLLGCTTQSQSLAGEDQAALICPDGTIASESGGCITSSPTNTISGPIVVTPTVIAPTLSGGITHDWNFPGLDTAAIVHMTTQSGSPALTGLAGGTDGRVIVLTLTGLIDPLTISKLDPTSISADQFLFTLPGGQQTIPLNIRDESITLIYDGAAQKWRILSKNF